MNMSSDEPRSEAAAIENILGVGRGRSRLRRSVPWLTAALLIALAVMGYVWLRSERSLCETWPAHLQAETEGDGLRVTVLDRVHHPAQP